MLGGSARSSQVRDLEIAVSVEMRAADAVFCNERWRQVEGWPTICEGADCDNPLLCMFRVAICLHSAVCFLIQTLPNVKHILGIAVDESSASTILYPV
jgi:hypothetical protein